VGHEAGKIAAPPAIVGDFLLLPVNGAPQAAIRVFSIASGKEEPLVAVQSIAAAGSIAAAPAALGRGALVITEQGGLFVLDRTAADDVAPFRIVASRPGSLEKAVHYAVPGGSAFWLADRTLTRYRIQGARIEQEAFSDLGMKFLQAPVMEGGTMFQVLQAAGMPGVVVSTFNPETYMPVWQTWLASPLVAEPLLGKDSGKLTAVTKNGGLFRAPPDALKPSEKPWEPLLAIDSSRLTKSLGSLLPLGGERFALTSGAATTQIVIYDPQEQDRQFRRLVSPQEMSAAPGAFGGGLLAPCVNGQVFLLDADALGNMAKPLEPPVKGVTAWSWETPAAVDDKLAVLSDGDRRLMTIGISKADPKALTAVATAATKNGLVSPVAVLGQVVFVVARNAVDATDSLLSFGLPKLTPGKSHVLGTHCAWGPRRVGKMVLVATEEGPAPTEKGRLLAIDERQQVVWQKDLDYGPLAGMPYVSGDEIFLSARSGIVWRISAADGSELGKVDAGCPLGTGPVLIGGRVMIGGHEGSLLEVKRP
jgi:outer membrane protein assembly factor BamB